MLLVVSPLKLWVFLMSAALFLVGVGFHPSTATCVVVALYSCWEILAAYAKCRHLNDGVRIVDWKLERSVFL